MIDEDKFREKMDVVSDCHVIVNDIFNELSTAECAETLDQLQEALANIRDFARNLAMMAR